MKNKTSLGALGANLVICPLILILHSTPGVSNANGLSTHVWITLDASSKLPEGPIKEIVADPAYRDMLISGTMFPDGGYAVGDNYGEIAHWEPFQILYIDWIRKNYSEPWSAEAKQHIAFVLGMTSHGMADQVFDSLYMERAERFDSDSDWANKSMDEATDVAFVSQVGPQTVPARWLPVDTLIEIFQEGAGYAVDSTTLNRGQNLVGLAVAVVGMLGQDPEAVRDYEQQFPWASTHMLDQSVPGNPDQIGTVVAEYWQRIWSRLHEASPVETGMLAHIPVDPGFPVSTSSASIDSWLTVVFPVHVKKNSIPDGAFELLDEKGQSYPFSTWLFYRDNSHVLHLQPSVGLPAEADLTLHLRKEITNAEGYTLAPPWSVNFTTRIPESPPAATTESAPLSDDSGCACSHGQARPSQAGIKLILLLCLFFLGRSQTTRRKEN